jgi:hypothetical protein
VPGLFADGVGGDCDDNDDEAEDGKEHCGDVEGGPIFGFGGRLGDAEEINEADGDVSQDSHVEPSGWLCCIGWL